MSIDASILTTPTGPLTLLVADGAVVAGGFVEPEKLRARLPEPLRSAPVRIRRSLGDVTDAAVAYFDGDLSSWDRLPISQYGGLFMQQAWETLRAVPPSTTVTYTELAAMAGRPAAVRAAAAACAANLVTPIVPCHRVLRRDGSLGGYRYGLPVKRWLLDHEAP